MPRDLPGKIILPTGILDFPIFQSLTNFLEFVYGPPELFFCQNRATGLYFNVSFRFCPGIVYIFIFSLFLSGLPDFVRPLLPINNYPRRGGDYR